jgi:DnaJ domain
VNVFSVPERLASDIQKYALRPERLPKPFVFPSTEVGRLLILFASGRFMPSGDTGNDTEPTTPSVAEADRANVQHAALTFVRREMMASDATHFTRLGVGHNFSQATLRENYRRLMALVHPDANPEGFPSDAATRVNEAYDVLTDDDKRANYVQREFTNLVVPSGRRRPSHRTQRHEAPAAQLTWKEKLRARFDNLQMRPALLALAALLLLPLVIVFGVNYSSAPPLPQIVEARPQLSMSSEVGTSSSRSATTPSAPGVLSDNVNLASAITTTPSKSALGAEKTSADTANTSIALLSAAPSTPVVAIAAPLKMDVAPRSSALQPTAAARAPDVATPPRSDDKSAAAPPPPKKSVSLAPQKSSSIETTAAGGTIANPLAPAAASPPPQQNASITPAESALSPTSTSAPIARAPAATDVVRTSEVEDLLLKFANAYASGSIDAMTRFMSPAMTTKRKLLTDYDRIFQNTSQREIRFGQLKHASNGERVTTSGYATVTTVDHNNRTAVQRVYLEFEIGKDRGEPRIERLANYVIN